MIRVSSFGLAAMVSIGLAAVTVPDAVHAAGVQSQQQSPQRSDQGEASKQMRAGNVLSLRQIEAKILPRMRGSEYLGPSYDSVARAYRLKFIKDGRVTYVDVDARTGRIINRSR